MSCSKQVLGIVLLGFIAVSAVTVKAFTCGPAEMKVLLDCGSFLKGAEGPKPNPQCCASAKALEKLVGDTINRKAMCECFKEGGPSFGVKPERAKLLASLCHLSPSVPISPDVNCDDIK